MIKNGIKNQIKGKKVIGVGARRIVYDLGNDFVLKVAKTKHGVTSNKREVITYHSSPPPIRKHLAQIIEYGKEYRWLKMKKYHHDIPRYKKFNQQLYKLRVKFREYGIIPNEVLDDKGKPNRNNLRVTKYGKIVVIDYGNFRFRIKK